MASTVMDVTYHYRCVPTASSVSTLCSGVAGNPTATLGQARNHLRDAATKWAVVLPGKDDAPGWWIRWWP